MRRLLHGLLGATLLLGACGDDDGGDPSAVTSIPEETTSTSPTTTEPRTVSPDVIPQDANLITEEYVEQVLNELLEVSLQATKHTRDVGLVDEVTIDLVESISSSERATQSLNTLIDAANAGFEGFRNRLSAATAEVLEVIVRKPDCVFAEVDFDNSGLFENPQPLPENVRGFARLVPATQQQRDSGHNTTAWMIDLLPATEDGTVPAEGCDSR